MRITNWSQAMMDEYKKNTVLNAILYPQPAAPTTFMGRVELTLYRWRYKAQRARERFGEIIAGRRFE